MKKEKCEIINQRETSYRAVIPFYILFDLDLNDNHYRLYGQIEQMESNPDPKVNPTFSYDWLSYVLGIDRSNVIRTANVLKKKGYIERVHIKKNEYLWKTMRKGLVEKMTINSGVATSATPLIQSGVAPTATSGVALGATQISQNLISQNISVYEDKQPTSIMDSYQETKNQFITEKAFTQKVEELKQDCMRDIKCQEEFNNHLGAYDVEFIDVLDSCVEYYGLMDPPQFVGTQRFQKWIRTTDPEKNGYQTKKKMEENIRKNEFTPDESELIQDLAWQRRNPDKPPILRGNKLIKAEALAKLAEEIKNVRLS